MIDWIAIHPLPAGLGWPPYTRPIILAQAHDKVIRQAGRQRQRPKALALRESYNLLLPSSAEALAIVMIGLGSVPNVEPNHGEMQKVEIMKRH